MSQNFHVNGFKWVANTSQFDEDFMKSYNENCDEGKFFKVDVQYPEKLNQLHNDLTFIPKRMEIEKERISQNLLRTKLSYNKICL